MNNFFEISICKPENFLTGADEPYNGDAFRAKASTKAFSLEEFSCLSYDMYMRHLNVNGINRKGQQPSDFKSVATVS